ncbi:hydroxyethylthiazole kinase [Companilactobacillus sp.]|jgi:hydroxyethylthiazole kinase|uniref:hydroxyethylthiazole kinase n=1 Tax=Companilactobacillus sp. TaxID=2767905 RepID=UPI0025C0FFF6|nr:hydroxyethylthiazole kinase [Companilactobacillus sp.]MCH4009667.1 hydroxyethylthiazole kinase [Companilactobacillus sp.]MCH4052657.1 hydroxyethylthiazole kinase [Companilactobacillus sp.]MCH4077609.1 hydroxyethylthiazole kinase [Companilactobacillus sp.]MCH4126185.1 hydroxyethylthiazole kinase [Companilactobacillus sp.]MCI1311893.1 hydroxyethylthiazole kinase [Companilactobacillus sp.]
MENYSRNNFFTQFVKDSFPIQNATLVHCITNEITEESVANALLYINAKPVMASDTREFSDFFSQTDSLFLNLGHISPEREETLFQAGKMADETDTPFVVDLVGIASSTIRYNLAFKLSELAPTIIKGNTSEMRAFCNLDSEARGVDASIEDQADAAIDELLHAMKGLASRHPETTFIATGETDLVVCDGSCFELHNGVPELDRFTGTGDIVGAMMAALIKNNHEGLAAGISAISYLNICAENASQITEGLADFRQQTLNQLSLLMNNDYWFEAIRGAVHA